jgi:hypothetical protein
MTDRASAYCAGLLVCVFSGLLAACSNTAPNNNINKVTGPALYEGYHDITDCKSVLGWAWDKNRPDEPIQVDIYDGDTLLATVTAADFRQDLLSSGHGNGKHAFTYLLPPHTKDSKPHAIRLRYAGTSIDLGNTPKEIKCTFEP